MLRRSRIHYTETQQVLMWTAGGEGTNKHASPARLRAFRLSLLVSPVPPSV
jgi:hypothetical protein